MIPTAYITEWPGNGKPRKAHTLDARLDVDLNVCADRGNVFTYIASQSPAMPCRGQ